MANHKSAKKRIRQTDERRIHNKYYHKTTRNAVKALRNTTAKARIEAGERTADGEEITLPEDPGQRVSMMDGVALWQRDLLEYGTNQGFTMSSAS